MGIFGYLRHWLEWSNEFEDQAWLRLSLGLYLAWLRLSLGLHLAWLRLRHGLVLPLKNNRTDAKKCSSDSISSQFESLDLGSGCQNQRLFLMTSWKKSRNAADPRRFQVLNKANSPRGIVSVLVPASWTVYLRPPKIGRIKLAYCVR